MSITRRGFRKLILLWWLLGISCVVVTVTTNRFLPVELRAYMEAQSAGELTISDGVLFVGAVLLIVANVIISVGLYRFKPWAKRLLLPSQLLPLILLPFLGPAVMMGWANFMSYLSTLFTGAFLVLVYSPAAAHLFDGDTQHALRADSV